MKERTPTEHRIEVDEWRSTAPKNDSAIMRAPRHSKKPRHSALAEEFKPLLTWKWLTEREDPLKTNWCVRGGIEWLDDSDEPVHHPSTESEHEIRPTDGELEMAVRAAERGDIEYATEDGGDGPVAAVGRLRFKTSFGEYRDGYKTLPRGAMIAFGAARGKRGREPVDSFGTPKGPRRSKELAEQIEASNAYFAKLFDAQPCGGVRRAATHRHSSDAPRPKTPAASVPLNEARAMCGLPPVLRNDNRPGLPNDRVIADVFLGCQIKPRQTPGDAQQTTLDEIIRAEEIARVRGRLSAEDAKTLDWALECDNFEELGAAFGYAGKTAERQGKSRLQRALKSLSAVLQKGDA